MQHAMECSSIIFPCAECHATLWHIHSCQNMSHNTKNNAMQHHSASFCCHGTKHNKLFCGSKSFAMAQRALPWHKKPCRGTKSFAVAWRTLPWHEELCHGAKTMVAAHRALPWQEVQCRGTKKSLQHKMQCRSTKNMAAAPTPNTSTARLIVFYLGMYLDFFPENCFGLLWKVPDVTVYWWLQHLFHQWLPTQKVFCKTFAGLLLFCIMIIF